MRSDYASCSFLGSSGDFPSKIVLPTTRSVLNLRQHLKIVETKPGIIPGRHLLTTRIASDVLEIWESASVPTIERRPVSKRISNLINEYLDLLKSLKLKSNSSKFQIQTS